MRIRVKRFFLLWFVLLLTLVGCSVSKEKKEEESTKPIQAQHLNLTQADLIAKVTDNAKYLNPDLLYEVNGLEDTDEVGVIVTLDSKGIADAYFKNSLGYDSVGSYALSNYGIQSAKEMVKEQEALAKSLEQKGLILSTKHSYTTLVNGFSARTTFGNYKKLVQLGLAEKVSISEVYALPTAVSSDAAIENVVDVYDTGIFNSSSVEYDGENTAVAILDSGFDIHHSVFQNMPKHPMISKSDVSVVLRNTKANSFTSGLKVEDVYVNEKIPFAYDYADKDPDVAPFDSEHGTHVAGIIGGHDDVITGVAVNTQLVMLKVFGDLVTGAQTEDILAALEDAVVLGVDAINMSLGSSCGFSYLEDDDYLNSVYNKIEQAGISLVCAASNDYSSAYGGEEGNTNKVTNPDSATVGSPSTYNAALSVASISGTKSKYIEADDGYIFYFNEANNAAALPYDFIEMLNLPAGQDVEYEYVTVPGYGKKINYSNVDVKGKVALVKRGDNSFEDKAKIAYEEGAVACIVYNNIGGDILMSAGNNLQIPLCSISKDDGEHLASKVTGKLRFNTNNLAGPFMSDFSSWGPNPDLKLKPEITAHGGNIKSSIPGGEYDELSGTSMACPNMAGIVVLIRQYLKEKFPTAEQYEIATLTNELLMSSATIALDQYGNPYSPRKQGAGLASLYNAVNTKAYLTVDGSNKAKIELGDDPKKSGVYTLRFTINNMSNSILTYDLDNDTMTESVSTSDNKYVAEKSYMLNPSTKISVTGDGSCNGNRITVAANGVVEVEYTLTLSSSEKRYIRTSFSNGMFVEGFAKLISQDEKGIDLSIPFLAFFGDWTVAPMFDKTYYEIETEAHDASINEEDKIKADYYATTPLGTYYYNYIIPLGSYVYTMDADNDPIPATEEHAAMGYSVDTINGITCVYAGLLRNAKKMTTTITNTLTGEVVYEHINYNQFKAHYSGGQIPSYDLIELSIEELGLANNTNYTFTMVGELAYGDGGMDTNLNNSFSFTFYVDFEAPFITDVQFRTEYDKTLEKDKYYADVYVYDNHYTMSVRPFTLVDGSLVSLCTNPTPVYGERGTINKVTLEITDYMDLLQYSTGSDNQDGLTNGLGIMVDDYAMNSNYYYVSFPGTNASSFHFEDGEGNTINTLDLTIGEEVDLASMIVSNDPNFDPTDPIQSKYMSTLHWETNNPDVVQVKNGKIEGVGLGTGIITAQVVANDGYFYTASIEINVQAKQTVSYSESEVKTRPMAFSNSVRLEDIQFTYFDTVKAFIDGPEYSEIGQTGDRTFFTNTPSISFYPSEQVKIGYEITPWNLDRSRYKLEWTSSNPNVASVDSTGKVTALKEGSAIVTLRITVDGKLSSLLARVSVHVKNEFIVENRTLTGYKGLGGEVVIPDDLGIMYIGSYAFSLYTTDASIKVDEDDWDANKTAGGNETVTSVVIPFDVTEVQKYAFYNCPNLQKVTFLKSSKNESCKTIREYAFYHCSNLREINTERIQIIGANAFNGCSSLASINFDNIYALGDSAFKGCTALQTVDITKLRNAWPNVFEDCTNLTSITSGEFTKFSEGMFKNTGLTELTFYADRIPASTFENCSNLTDVVIANDIIYVGESAFHACTKLKNFTFNGSCDYIYGQAFRGCTGLNNFVLPNSMVSLDQYIFMGCTNLATVRLQAKTEMTENFGVIFENCDKLTTFVVDGDNTVYSAEGHLLLNKDGDTIILAAPGYNYGNSYSIPAKYVRIGEGAFSGIGNLNSVTFAGTPEIGDYAFAECIRLGTVILPSTPIKIGLGAFEACINLNTVQNLQYMNEIGELSFASTSLKNINIGDGTKIGEGAFSQIPELMSVTLGNNVEIGEGAFFQNTKLNTVNMGAEGGIKIGAYAFENCVALTTIDLTKASGTIGTYAFYNCTVLPNVNLENITRVEEFAFGDCPGIQILKMPIVEYIGDAAFAKVSTETDGYGAQMSTLVLPETLTYIGEAAFYACTNLTSIRIPSSVETVLGFAFANCLALQTADVNEMTEIPECMFLGDGNLITVLGDNITKVNDSAFYSCLYLENIDLSKVTEFGEDSFSGCGSLQTADLQAATYLGAGAFFAAEELTTLNIPKVKYIGEQALSDIGVTTIVIPETIEYIAPTAFYGNENQTNFVAMIDGSLKSTGVINSYARLYNSGLYTISDNGSIVFTAYPAGKGDREYTVMPNTERIEIYASAENLYLRKIILPDSLASIGNMAFYNCNNLETVEFRSTVAPVLEGVPYGSSGSYQYSEGSKVYNLFYKYMNFNGYYPLYYGQFKAMVGTINPLNIILPSNTDVEGYDNLLYDLYFDLDHMERSNYLARNKYTLDYLEKIALVPEDNITFKDEKVIVDARTAYNALNQDLAGFGYTRAEIDAMRTRLENAEATIRKIKTSRVNEKYSDLIADIRSLAGVFDPMKYDTYKYITIILRDMDASEKSLLDLTTYNAYQQAYQAYVKQIGEDVTTIDEISRHSTAQLAAAAVLSVISSVTVAGFAIGKAKHWF